MFTTAIKFLLEHIDIVVSVVFLFISFVINVVQFIKYIKQGKLKEALDLVPSIIREVEKVSRLQKLSSIEKKAMCEALLIDRFGSLYKKNSELFNYAIEDILDTPQKKGGSLGV